jgi:hypothetical protein
VRERSVGGGEAARGGKGFVAGKRGGEPRGTKRGARRERKGQDASQVQAQVYGCRYSQGVLSPWVHLRNTLGPQRSQGHRAMGRKGVFSKTWT